MSQIILQGGDALSKAYNDINDNFTELYGKIPTASSTINDLETFSPNYKITQAVNSTQSMTLLYSTIPANTTRVITQLNVVVKGTFTGTKKLTIKYGTLTIFNFDITSGQTIVINDFNIFLRNQGGGSTFNNFVVETNITSAEGGIIATVTGCDIGDKLGTGGALLIKPVIIFNNNITSSALTSTATPTNATSYIVLKSLFVYNNAPSGTVNIGIGTKVDAAILDSDYYYFSEVLVSQTAGLFDERLSIPGGNSDNNNIKIQASGTINLNAVGFGWEIV